jgi:hypothetical protein
MAADSLTLNQLRAQVEQAATDAERVWREWEGLNVLRDSPLGVALNAWLAARRTLAEYEEQHGDWPTCLDCGADCALASRLDVGNDRCDECNHPGHRRVWLSHEAVDALRDYAILFASEAINNRALRLLARDLAAEIKEKCNG